MGSFGNTPLGPYRVFSSSEPQNFTDPIPIGQHVIRYLGQDSYGTQTILDIDFEVGDNNLPTAVCRQTLTISLDEDGTASLPALELNQGSFDDCSAVTFTLTRAGGIFFRERLIINCNDFGSITTTLRVTDATGNNRTECNVEVTVTDLQRPTCTAPPSTNITCRTFTDNLPINLREVFTSDPRWHREPT